MGQRKYFQRPLKPASLTPPLHPQHSHSPLSSVGASEQGLNPGATQSKGDLQQSKSRAFPFSSRSCHDPRLGVHAVQATEK